MCTKPGPVCGARRRGGRQAFALRALLYAVVADRAFGMVTGPKSRRRWPLARFLILGLSPIFAGAGAWPMPAPLRAGPCAPGPGVDFAAAVAYFGFQALASVLLGSALPNPAGPGALEMALIVLAGGQLWPDRGGAGACSRFGRITPPPRACACIWPMAFTSMRSRPGCIGWLSAFQKQLIL